MLPRVHVVRAVAGRELGAWFSNPTGYVFLTLFVLLASVAAFLPEPFFARNLADLAVLDGYVPLLLLFFVPSVTMALWAEERRQGTDEILLTLPVRDGEVVLGKYLGALGVYSTALLFSLTNLVVLAALGDPDPGLLLGTYLGYWLMGAALLGVGMVGSALAANVTVGFILGALLCSVVVFADRLGLVLGGRFADLLADLGVRPLFADFTSGVVSIPGVCLFAGVALAALHANVGLLRWRRHGRGPLTGHDLVRTASVAAAVAAVVVLADRVPVRPDLTQERLHSLSPETRRLLGEIDPARPVYLQAFVSPEVPREHLETRDNLLALLREVDRLGGDRVVVRVQDTERYTEAAREAEDKFGIRPREVISVRHGRGSTASVYLGLVATCGLQEVVVPFLHPGISVEYELTRSLRTASQVQRLRVGILRTDAELTGGFDFQRMQSNAEWPIVTELKKQYEVTAVDPDTDYPPDLHVLVAAMASSLTQPQMDRLRAWAGEGRPVLLFEDPLPLENPALAPKEPKPKPGGNNPFGGGAPPAPKGDARALLDGFGVAWPVDDVVWDSFNPHPQFAQLPPEVVFVSAESPARPAMHPTDTITSGLQEVVLIFAGRLMPSASAGSVEFTPLLRTTTASGVLASSDIIQRSFFGFGGLNPRRAHRVSPDDYVVAARVRGDLPSEGAGAPARKVNAVVVADLDMVSRQFFDLRAQGVEGLEFDNVTFVLNAVDVLAGDESFVALRKRRRRLRTLSAVEDLTRVHTDRQLERSRDAEAEAKRRLDEAQAALDGKVDALRKRTDLDDRTRDIMVATLEQTENRKFEVTSKRIEDERDRAVEASRAESATAIRGVQHRIKVLAVMLPPIPALLLGLWILRRRILRERRADPASRRMGEGVAP